MPSILLHTRGGIPFVGIPFKTIWLISLLPQQSLVTSETGISVPCVIGVHLILSNYGTHKYPEVKKWFAERPHYQEHGSIRLNAGLPKSLASEVDAECDWLA
jgi:hypothetical protein